MKLIKMRTLAAGPDGTLDPGKTYPVNDKAAAALVDGGFADYAEITSRKATRPWSQKGGQARGGPHRQRLV